MWRGACPNRTRCGMRLAPSHQSPPMHTRHCASRPRPTHTHSEPELAPARALLVRIARRQFYHMVGEAVLPTLEPSPTHAPLRHSYDVTGPTLAATSLPYTSRR